MGAYARRPMRKGDLHRGRDECVVVAEVGRPCSTRADPVGPQDPARRPGVYVVETPKPLRHAPVDKALVEAWIGRVATLRLDSATPSAEMVIHRLQPVLDPAETVVYIGLAGTSLATRVGQYYRTPLGDPRPHAGGHWIKTLGSLDTFLIWFAASSDPTTDAEALLHAFGDRHGSRSILPFANLEDARRVRKPHGITGARLSRSRVAARAADGRADPSRTATDTRASADPPERPSRPDQRRAAGDRVQIAGARGDRRRGGSRAGPVGAVAGQSCASWPSAPEEAACRLHPARLPGGRSLLVHPMRRRPRAWWSTSNDQRLHSACGDILPAEFEAAYH